MVAAIVRRAFRAAMRLQGATGREAARWMRVNRSTIQRYMSKGFSLPVLRSRRLGGVFVLALCDELTKQNRKAKNLRGAHRRSP